MRTNSSQSIQFSNKRELKKFQSIHFTYSFKDIYFRFTRQSIYITKINGANSYKEINLQNDHILEDIKRFVSQMGEKCKIDRFFPQYESIYLLIEVNKNYYLAEITIQRVTHELKNIFNSVIKVQNTSIFEQLMDMAIMSYKFFGMHELIASDAIILLAKNQEQNVFSLFRGKMKNDVIIFQESTFRQRQNKNGAYMYNKVYFTKSQFVFLYSSGERRIHKFSKANSQYSQKNDLMRIIQDDMRIKKQIQNGAYNYVLVSTCQTPLSFYFLFAVSSINNRYILIKWIKEHDFSQIKQYNKYSFTNVFGNLNQINLCCLMQMGNKSLMILEQDCIYFFLEVSGSDGSRLWHLKVDQPNIMFGIHDNLLLQFDSNSYSEVSFKWDQNNTFLHFSLQSRLNVAVSNLQSSIQTKSISQTAINNQKSSIVNTDHSGINASNKSNTNNDVKILQILENNLRKKPQIFGKSLIEPRPIIDFKGNNRLSNSTSNQPNQCLSQVDEEQQQIIINSVSPNLRPTPPPINQQSNNIFSRANSPKINPFSIIKDHINPNPSPRNPPNTVNSANSDNLFSLNPSQTINMKTTEQNPGLISFGVPAPQQCTQPKQQEAIQMPKFNRGFSFGNDNQKNNMNKQVNIKKQSKKNIKLLRQLPYHIKKYLTNIKYHAEEVKKIDQSSNSLNLKENFVKDLKLVSQNLKRNKILFYNPQIKPFQTIMMEIKQLQTQFQTKFEMISNKINQKIQQFGLNHKIRPKKSAIQQIDDLRKRNAQKIHKTIITFKLKIDKMNEECSKIHEFIKSKTIEKEHKIKLLKSGTKSVVHNQKKL